jgi:hypothetical protein
MEEGWESLKDAAVQAAEYEREHQLTQRAQAALLEGQERCEMRRCNCCFRVVNSVVSVVLTL